MNKKSFKIIGLVSLVASTVLLVACQSDTKNESSKSKDVQWGYTGSTGPDHWGDLSKDYELSKNGKEQSPINITGAEDVDLPELNLNNQESEAQVENYKNDHFVEVTEDVLETIQAAERAEAAYDRRVYRYKAHYSLDCDNGIENAILMKPQTPEMLLEEKQFQEQVYAAVMKLPEKQAKRIYARYYLGMTVNEIAEVEGVDPSRVRDSIRRGLKQLVKYF